MNFLFSIEGRIGRLQWWLGQLIILIWVTAVIVLTAVVLGVSSYTGASAREAVAANTSAILFLFASLVPVVWLNAATTIKRFHDRDKSGFWYFISFIPYIGSFWVLVECGFLPGTAGGNTYGDRGGNAGLHAEIAELKAKNRASTGGAIARSGNEVPFQYSVVEQRSSPTNNFGSNNPPVFGKRGR